MEILRPCFKKLQRDNTAWGRHWGVTTYPYVVDCGHEDCHHLDDLLNEQRNLASSHFTHIRCNCDKIFSRLHNEIEVARMFIKPLSEWEGDKRVIESDRETGLIN